MNLQMSIFIAFHCYTTVEIGESFPRKNNKSSTYQICGAFANVGSPLMRRVARFSDTRTLPAKTRLFDQIYMR